ncbi:MAG: glutamyl-tRNA reductase [Actinobacteria bacterium]|nr:glutamyl-tRNA reductase [Actinomycetota bacterium]
MLVVVTGISHKTATLDLRERLALDEHDALRMAQELLDGGAACETLALSTCNRTELYLYGRDSLAARQAAVERLAKHAGVPPGELEASIYSYSGDAAIAHLFRVTSSLDSMVVGEAQIAAQMKAAYQRACEGGCTSVVFNRLFRHAFEVGKRVRTETAIGELPVSVSSAAVELALQVFGKFRDHTVLIVGAGETSELTVTHLKAHGIKNILVTNRTLTAAEELAHRVGGRAVPFEDLEGHVAAADIVISSTSAPHYVITRERVERSLKRRRHRPIFFIDIAVPRDLDPEIDRVRNAYLYDIDDLQHVVEQNRGEREKEAHHAERIIEQELASVNNWLRSLEVVPTIATLRDAMEQIRRAELERLSGKLGDLSDEQRAQVDMLTASIVNKILHLPTVRMKEVAGSQECYLYVDAVRTLFDLRGNEPVPEDVAVEPAPEPGADDRPAAGADDPPGATVHHLRGTGTDDA